MFLQQQEPLRNENTTKKCFFCCLHNIYVQYIHIYDIYVFVLRWIAPELIFTTCIIAPEALCWHKRKWNQDFDSISNLIVRLLLWMISFESRRIWRIWESHHSLQYWGGADGCTRGGCTHLEKVQQTCSRRGIPNIFSGKARCTDSVNIFFEENISLKR